MNVNGVTNQRSTSELYSSQGKTAEIKETQKPSNDSGVIYEKSEEGTKKTYKQNPELIAKLKADAEEKTAQLRSLVEKMISKQGNAYGQATDMWKFLASGDFTVDAETKAQAQADIAEDGYWGVAKTSDRIIEFATALSGGDPDKMKEMKEAFEKGFKEATKSWGKDLPSISSQTYDSVMSKFDELLEDSNKTQEPQAPQESFV